MFDLMLCTCGTIINKSFFNEITVFPHNIYCHLYLSYTWVKIKLCKFLVLSDQQKVLHMFTQLEDVKVLEFEKFQMRKQD